MDPDANLEEQMSLVKWLNEHEDGECEDDLSTEAYRLAQLVEALNGWICSGGFPPKSWTAMSETPSVWDLIKQLKSRPDFCMCDDTMHKKGMECT